MKRIWNLRLNLDELNALNLTGLTEHIRSELWSGLVFGCNGLSLPEGASDYIQTTFEVASEWREEAEGHRARMSEGGKKSVSKRRSQFGSAQPNRTTIELPSEGGSEGSLNQSTIYNLQSNNIQSTIDNPPSEKESSPSRARPSAKKKELTTPPEHFLPKLATIAKDWPRHSDYKGVPTRVSVLARPSDVWERIVRFVAGPDRELAINCGLVYLDEIDSRDKGVDGLIPNVCAMTNFYGEAELWKKMVAKVDEALSKRGENA